MWEPKITIYKLMKPKEYELKFAKFVRWLLKLVYKEEFVVVTRVQWDSMIKTRNKQSKEGKNNELGIME